MQKAIGIDLGTTNSVVAVWDGDKASVIPNSEGARTTPSVVAFNKDGERLAGQIAQRQAVVNSQSTVHSAKRFVGRKWGEVDEESKIVSYKVVQGPADAVRFDLGGKQVAPEEVSAQVLRKLVDDASSHLGEKVKAAVITVPAYFNDAQRQATKTAGEIAGLKVLRIVNEPTAAALAYGLEKNRNETVLVFDLGGGTFDVSILDVGDGVCEVRATSGDTHLGGDDFDKRVVDWVAAGFKKEAGIDLKNDRQALQRLLEAAEKAKCELSSTVETEINLPFITADASGPKHLTQKITRAKFEDLIHDLVKRCKQPVEQALGDAKLTADDIDELILVGGSTRVPVIQSLVKKLTRGKAPNMSVNPDEVVALGAAIQAAVIQGEMEDVVLLDVIPLSLGVETHGGVMTRLIDRNTTIPCRREEVFSTADDNQTAVDVVVLQGEREMASDNRILGRFRLDGIPPAPRGIPQVKVAFDVNANGILNVTAKEEASGREQTVTITESTNLDQSEVERMVREAEQHAAQDKQRRENIDACHQTDSLTYQLERLLEDMGGKAAPHEKARCEQLVAESRAALKDELTPKARHIQLASDLQQALSMMGAVASQRANPSGSSADAYGTQAAASDDDDVVDTEFVQR